VLAARLAGWFSEYTTLGPFGTLTAMIIVIATSTYVSLILVEMLPKQSALKYPEAMKPHWPLRLPSPSSN
jgi:CBS domain containing-hemolysin-like protein